MKLKPQQVSKDILPVPSGKEKKSAKKAAARKMRRAVKQNAQEAPKKKQYHGWNW